MIAAFDLPQIGRSPARFDFAKLENLNGHYLRQTADADLLVELERVLAHGGCELASKLTPQVRRQLLAAMGALKERAKTLVELADGARFITAERPLQIDQRAAAVLTPGARPVLGEVAGDFKGLEALDGEGTGAGFPVFAQGQGMKL